MAWLQLWILSSDLMHSVCSLSPVLSNETELDIPMLNVKNYNPVITCMHVPMHTRVTMSVHWLIYSLTQMYEPNYSVYRAVNT
jgi:hypothetical protein